MIIPIDIKPPKRVEKVWVMNYGFTMMKNIVVNY